MTTDAIYEEHGSDWSHQVSAMGTTRWLQGDQTLPLSGKGVACEIIKSPGYRQSRSQAQPKKALIVASTGDTSEYPQEATHKKLSTAPTFYSP